MTEYEAVVVSPGDTGLHGRRKIFTDKRVITPENIVDVVSKGYGVHIVNRREIQYLFDVYRGIHDIRYKEKVVRPEVNNKVTVNIPNEIVTVKSALFLSSPIQYASVNGKDSISKSITQLNEYMREQEKEGKDKEAVDWFHICGVASRMALANPTWDGDGSPFIVYPLDPREAFVIYYSGIGNAPQVGVVRQKDEDGKYMFVAYTKDTCYWVKGKTLIRAEPHTYGMVPIIEYVNNMPRIGAFENVLSIINTIDILESNRVDNVVDFVNAFDVFQNCEIDDENYQELSGGGKAICIKNTIPGMESKVYRITSEMNQAGVQSILDDLTDRYITICGLPNRNGGSSTSDTGAGVQYRDGWVEAESRAKDTEKMYNVSEMEFLKLILKICNDTVGLDLKPSDVKIEHTRNNLSNMQTRMQILCEGLSNENIHPRFPWVMSGVPNAEEWYQASEEYKKKNQEELARSLTEELNAGRGTVSSGGQSHSTTSTKSNQAVRQS